MGLVIRIVPVLLLLFTTPHARSQEHPLPVARWSYAPPAGLEARAWEPAARVALAGEVLQGDAAAVTSGLLAAAQLSRHRHTIDLQGFDDRGWPVFTLRVEAAPEAQERLLRSLRAVLLALGPGGAQSPLEGRVEYSAPAWPEGFKVSWSSGADAMTVGVGAASLEVGPGPAVDVVAHEQAIGGEAQEPRFALAVDADKLRSYSVGDDPPALVARDLLAGWGLANARSVVYRGARYPGSRQLGVWVSWSPRSRQPGDVRASEQTERAWPVETLGAFPAEVGEAIVLRQNLGGWLTLGLRAAIALQQPGSDRQRALADVNRWGAAVGPPLQRILGSLGPVVAITDQPGPPLDLPGLGTAMIPIDQDPSGVADVGADLATVLQAAGLAVVARGEQQDRMWRVGLVPERFDPGGVLSLLRWTVLAGPSGPVLVIGWNEASLDAAEDWLRAGVADAAENQGDG